MADGCRRCVGTPDRDETAPVARARNGDPSAFEDLVRPYAGRVYQTALRITRNAAEAADVYRDTFLAAFEKLDAFRGTAAFGAWLCRIAANGALMRWRAAAHSGVVAEEDLPHFNWMGIQAQRVHEWAESAEAPAQRAELRAALSNALQALPEIDRTMVWLKDAEGLSCEEIASATGLTVSATRSHLHRARLWLRARLAQLVREEK